MEYKAKWMNSDVPPDPIVISSRVRLARNFKGLPFPGTMSAAEGQEVIARVNKIVQGDSLAGYEVLRMADLSQTDRLALVEQHLISYDLANKHEGAVVLSPDGAVAIMLNEEDHVRIQCLLPGLALEEAWKLANKCDDLLEQALNYAFHEDYGYLTACPTNVGTGMRSSVMLHLPALVESRQIGRLLTAIGQFGLMARGLYGEGTEARGNIFQISNQVTCGIAEDEIVRNLKAVVEQIIGQERTHLNKMLTTNRRKVEDRVYRALGLLTSARILGSGEATVLLSELRLGVSAKILSIPVDVLSELLVLVQPGVLQTTNKTALDALERDVLRGETVRKRLQEALGGGI